MNKLLLFVFAAISLCAHAEYDDTIFGAIRKDEDGVDDIRAYVEKDPSVLESIYEGGQKGTTIYKYGQTPLIFAALRGYPHAVKTLLELGANIHATEQEGYNVLHAAATKGQAETLEVLYDHIAENSIDMNITTDLHADGYYPLHRACWGHEPHHTETVRVMLEKFGVPYDLKSTHGKTCIHVTKNQGTLVVIANHAAKQAALAADVNTEL